MNLPGTIRRGTAARLREVYRDRFGVPLSKHIKLKSLEQLENCKDDAARRLLLGISSNCRPKGLKAKAALKGIRAGRKI